MDYPTSQVHRYFPVGLQIEIQMSGNRTKAVHRKYLYFYTKFFCKEGLQNIGKSKCAKLIIPKKLQCCDKNVKVLKLNI